MNITGINFSQALNAKRTQNQSFGKYVIEYDALYSGSKLIWNLSNSLGWLPEERKEDMNTLHDAGYTVTARMHTPNDTLALDFILTDSNNEELFSERGLDATLKGEQDGFHSVVDKGLELIG